MKRPVKQFGVFFGGLVLILCSCASVWADDTEIYFGGTGSSGATANVLFILDTSGSMTADDDGNGTSRMDDLKTAFKDVMSKVKNVNVGMMRFSNPGGPVMFPVANVDADASVYSSAGNVTSIVASGNDDGFEYVGSHQVVLTSTQLSLNTNQYGGATIASSSVSLVASSSDAVSNITASTNSITDTILYTPYKTDTDTQQRIVGLRFPAVSIPSGATIVRAYVELQVGDISSNPGPIQLDIIGEKPSTSAVFNTSSSTPKSHTSSSSNLLPRVSGSPVPVPWTINDFPSIDDVIRTPDISSIVQAEYNDSWGAGSGVVTVYYSKSALSASTAWIGFNSYDRSGYTAPRLVVEYYTGSASNNAVNTALRFTGVNVPKGATITDAHITFTASDDASTPTDLVVYAEKAGDSAALSTATGNISGRTLTSASVIWNSVAPWSGNTEYDTPNLSPIVQEVVNYSGVPTWCGGDSMTFVIKGSAGLRLASAYEDGSNRSPRLSITYSPSSVPASGSCSKQTISSQIAAATDDAEQKGTSMILSDTAIELVARQSVAQKDGFRFTNVKIPQGSSITNAYIEFTANNGSTAANTSVNLTIGAEAADNSTTFTSGSNNISNRTLITPTVAWSIPSTTVWTNGLVYQTPDISTLISSIVGRTGWSTGNALNIIVSGTDTANLRRASAFEQNSGQAARLVVTYRATGGSSQAGYTVRDELSRAADTLTANGYTPIQDVMYEAAQYFAGGPVLYGARRGGPPFTSPTTTNDGGPFAFTRVSHPGSYTGGTAIRSPLCTDANLSSSACASEYVAGTPNYITPITASCQVNHIVLLTDGLANRNHSDSLVKNLIGKSSCSVTGGEACVRELAAWLYNTDMSSSVSGKNNVITDTIAFNLNDPSGITFLQDVATQGHGTYYSATNAANLSTVLNTVLTSVLNSSSSFVAAGTAVNAFNRTQNLDELYFSVFTPDTVPRWGGNVKKYKFTTSPTLQIVDKNGANAVDSSTGFFATSSQSFWSTVTDGPDVKSGGAASLITNYTTRKVYTYLDSLGASSTKDLTAAVNNVSSTNTNITTTMMGLSGTVPTLSDLLDWTRGRDVQDENNNGSKTDTRFVFGDPIHSRPVAVTYGGTAASPDMTIFVSTNSGFLHAINSATGQELFSFIPQDLLPLQLQLFNNSQNTPHPYGLDGSIVTWTIDPENDGVVLDSSGSIQPGNKVYLYVGMRRGGRNYYALDVTDRANPKILWVIKGGVTAGFDNLGQSWSQPLKAKINIGGTVRRVLILGGGYDVNQDTSVKRDSAAVDAMGNAIYIVDAISGALLWSGSSAAGVTKTLTDMKYGIPSGISGADISGDGLLDFFFVGDMGGQVWRFDVNQGGSGASLISGGVIADLNAGVATPTAANNRRFYHSPELFIGQNGSSPYLGVAIGSGWRAHPLNSDTTDKFYVIRQNNIFSAPSSYTKLYQASLFDATSNIIGEGTSGQQATGRALLAGSSGWFMNLINQGEKVLSTPVVVEGELFFDTYQPGTPPTANPCAPSTGINRAYRISVFDATPTLEQNGTAGLDSGDRATILNSSGITDGVQPVYATGKSIGVNGTSLGILPRSALDQIHRNYWNENRQ